MYLAPFHPLNSFPVPTLLPHSPQSSIICPPNNRKPHAYFFLFSAMIYRPDRVTLYLIGSTPLFYQHMTDVLLPHLRLVHRFPTCFPSIRIDRGAIRFVLSGATLMAPGLTSAGGRLPTGNAGETGKYGETTAEGEGERFYGGRELEQGEPVVVCAEGKVEACAVGLLSMGTKEVKEKGKGPVVEDAHYLGDGLWKLALGD